MSDTPTSLKVPVKITGIGLAGDENDQYFNVSLLPLLPSDEDRWHRSRNSMTINLKTIDGLQIGGQYTLTLTPDK